MFNINQMLINNNAVEHAASAISGFGIRKFRGAIIPDPGGPAQWDTTF
jgi:hypothetical protein